MNKYDLPEGFFNESIVVIHRLTVEKIVKRPLMSYQDIENAAAELLVLGAKSVLITSANVDADARDPQLDHDYWTKEGEAFWLSYPNKEKNQAEALGKEAIYFGAIQAFLARDVTLKDAIVLGKMVLLYTRRKGVPFDKENIKADWSEDEVDIPYLSDKPLTTFPNPFTRYQPRLYPIVDSSHWVKLLLEVGVRCIQLRIKNRCQSQLEEEIKASVYLANQYKAILFINDYWQEAIRFGALGIHLGQEDLLNADIEAIYDNGLYLGLSTHCYYEVAKAHAYNPSYIACGPIYPTHSKIMSLRAQGLLQLARWRRTLNYPLVAIGGISLERYPKVLQTGVDGISLISAITKAEDPIWATQQLLNLSHTNV